jgi:hypothetical protein
MNVFKQVKPETIFRTSGVWLLYGSDWLLADGLTQDLPQKISNNFGTDGPCWPVGANNLSSIDTRIQSYDIDNIRQQTHQRHRNPSRCKHISPPIPISITLLELLALVILFLSGGYRHAFSHTSKPEDDLEIVKFNLPSMLILVLKGQPHHPEAARSLCCRMRKAQDLARS